MSIARVLVADSSFLVRDRLIAALLNALGKAQIEEASSHGETIERLERFVPHVVLLDARLSPGLLGDLVARSTRRGAAQSQVVVLTSDRASYASHCLAAGAFEVIDRSDADSVIRAVKAVLLSALSAA